uniref:ATP-binding protein n=1 Tax=Streptomyces sp. NBC_00093 TaxID=2975649 RepID=A0AAU2AHD7_9ACTN
MALYRLSGRNEAAKPRSTGYPGYSLTLARAPESAGEARRLVRVALAVWGLDAHADTAALLMSELVSNAIRHARGPAVRISVDRPAHDRVQLAVVDRAPAALPHLRTPSSDVIGGRGLLLVDELADRWGTDLKGTGPRRWGKRVWADVVVSRG